MRISLAELMPQCTHSPHPRLPRPVSASPHLLSSFAFAADIFPVSGPRLLTGSRWHSGASPNSLGLGGGGKGKERVHIETEEDVLHIRTLPTFDGTIGQADSELLISYLTVPYLRLPLLLQYFSSQNRLHTLASAQVRTLLQGVLLEPSRCEPLEMAGRCPGSVPATEEEQPLLGTPYGLLLNECARSPHLVPALMLELLQQVVQLSTQAYHCKTTTLILFVVRMTVYVESAIAFLLRLQGWPSEHPSMSLAEVPALKLSATTFEALKKLSVTYREKLTYVREKVLKRWLAELIVEEQQVGCHRQRTAVKRFRLPSPALL